MRSRLFLADLGGSERLKKSLANEGVAAPGTVPWAEYYESRRRLTEALNINSGLLALKQCVDALHEARKCREEGAPPPHVPFHDSKLTALLARCGASCHGHHATSARREDCEPRLS